MSTSLLYHGFGLRDHRYVRTCYVGGEVHFHIEHKPKMLRCSQCQSYEVILRGKKMRRFKTLPIGGRPVRIVLPLQRVECKECGLVRQVKIPFADSRKSYTRPLERYVLDLCKRMTIRDVARHLGMSWDTVKNIHKRHLHHRFARPRLKDLTHIAIDEISIGRGHRYLTVVLDLGTGAVVFVGRGRGADALEPFWKRLRRSGAHIQAVATDMLPAYISAVLENLPGAALVFDRFHVIKLYNEKLSALRRDLQREADRMHKQVLKGTRWLLLKRPENLEPERDEIQRLQEALKLNEPLALAYYMREELCEFWNQDSAERAEAFLDDWIARASRSGVRMLQKFARTLQGHRYGLLAWYEHPISTGPLEGTNNKIKTLQRRAYGYRDREYFRLRIYALHEQKYALIG